MKPNLGLGLLCVVLALAWSPATAGETDDRTARITIDPLGGLPVLFADGIRLHWIVPGDDAASDVLRAMRYDISDEDLGNATRRTLTSRTAFHGRHLIHRYLLPRAANVAGGSRWTLDLDVPAGAGIEMSAQPAFVPEPWPGFGAIYSKVTPVVVDADGQRRLVNDSAVANWFGIRKRFAAGLLRPVEAIDVRVDTARENLPRVQARPAGNDGRLRLELYAGPVDADRLAAVDPILTGMLYAALWDWLRLLCFGMAWLLASLYALLGHVGWSIVLLSLCVKLLMSPLTMLAERWQDSVNRTMAVLQPKIDAIKQLHRGEDAHTRILAVYREHRVNPLYPVKSAAGFLIQIPIFIAAFDMLGDSTLLENASFLWITDLAEPDRALRLPWALPFFGAYLNLLPVLMTAVTLLTSWLQADAALTPELLRRQRVRLYLMALVFFLLFYTFPAGMVLYWTTNNLLHLAKILLLNTDRTSSGTGSGR